MRSWHHLQRVECWTLREEGKNTTTISILIKLTANLETARLHTQIPLVSCLHKALPNKPKSPKNPFSWLSCVIYCATHLLFYLNFASFHSWIYFSSLPSVIGETQKCLIFRGFFNLSVGWALWICGILWVYWEALDEISPPSFGFWLIGNFLLLWVGFRVDFVYGLYENYVFWRGFWG